MRVVLREALELENVVRDDVERLLSAPALQNYFKLAKVLLRSKIALYAMRSVEQTKQFGDAAHWTKGIQELTYYCKCLDDLLLFAREALEEPEFKSSDATD